MSSQRKVRKTRKVPRGASVSRRYGSASGPLDSSSQSMVERIVFGPMRAQATTTSVAGGFPDAMRVTLRYSENIALTFTAGSAQTYEFRGNSLFDPNSTGTGAQPANYDDFIAHYNRYRVVGSRCRVIPANPGNNGTPHSVVLYPYNTTAASTTIEDSVAQPYSGLINCTTYQPCIISLSMSTAKILGRTQAEVIGSDNCQAVYNANPADVWYWKLVAQPTDRSTAVTLNFLFVIDYDAVFFDRIAGNLDARLDRLIELKKEKELRESKKAPKQSSDCKSDSGSEESAHEFELVNLRRTAGEGIRHMAGGPVLTPAARSTQPAPGSRVSGNGRS